MLSALFYSKYTKHRVAGDCPDEADRKANQDIKDTIMRYKDLQAKLIEAVVAEEIYEREQVVYMVEDIMDPEAVLKDCVLRLLCTPEEALAILGGA